MQNSGQSIISVCTPNPINTLLSKLETNILEAIQLTGYKEGNEEKEKSAEVELLVRRGDSHFYIKNTHGSRDTFLWDSSRLSPRGESISPTPQDEERELNRVVATLKKEYLPTMLSSLKEATTVSIQATLKFKNGIFHWVTLKHDRVYSN